ncbi:MAG: GNAT family N-acetyltransferase [Intrasporangium sp.]|uniref:GNAT family N-acetyltransferase n=1 Tax=Intrasporangium sp. TaxID=1925024 RepID=UPI003F80F2CC
MTDALRQAYDDQLREAGEIHDDADLTRIGPLWCVILGDGARGFVTYRDLQGHSGAALDGLIEQVVAHYRDATDVVSFEWKTRGHDAPADLTDRLVAHGFVPEERETVMVGEATGLAVEVPLPDGVVVRRAGVGGDLADDAARASELQERVFGRGSGPSTERLVADLQAHADRLTLWMAETSGRVVSAGRLSIVPGTQFAGLWGGATDSEWRGRGIYRALTAARARHALAHGVRYLHSDSTDMSKPILERNGLRPVTTTTPYIWTRPSS